MIVGLLAPLLPSVMPKTKKEKKEGFEDEATDGVALILILLFWAIDMVLFIWAIYLSFRRNNGFDVGSFLAACCCSPCYVVYALAVPVAPAAPRI
jgi:hypothetical protein